MPAGTRDALRMRPWLVVVGVVAAAALAATSAFGGAGGGTITTSAGVSSKAEAGSAGASDVTSAASGQCSKAEAIAAVKRLGLSDASPTHPVWKVLCGAFAGAGSQVMVASISGSDNAGMLYWAVFQWTGSEWQFLMKQRHAAIVTAVGSDIRETRSIYRPSDSRCCPSGGTMTRIWHWNGSRFAAGSWKQEQTSDAFFSPSGNIYCWMRDDDQTAAAVGCQTVSSPHHLVKMGAQGRLKIRRVPAAQCGCVPDNLRTLAYGKQTTVGRFRCESREVGVRCTVIHSGKGFLINRDGVSRAGPP